MYIYICIFLYMYVCMYVCVCTYECMHVNMALTQLAAGPQDEKRADDKQIERTKSAENCIAEVKRLLLPLFALFVDKKIVDE